MIIIIIVSSDLFALKMQSRRSDDQNDDKNN